MSEPKKCPICEGRGVVEFNFYNDKVGIGITPEECRTCEGIGILWANELVEDASTSYPPIYDNNSDPCENCSVRLSPTFGGVCYCTLPYIINPLIRW